MNPHHLFMNNLYILERLEDNGNIATATINLIKDHDIFKGHFPDNPILPGVCTIQIIKELMTMVCKKELQLTRAGNIKYLSFINPLVNNKVLFELSYNCPGEDRISCSARVYFETTTFCSFKGEFGEV